MLVLVVVHYVCMMYGDASVCSVRWLKYHSTIPTFWFQWLSISSVLQCLVESAGCHDGEVACQAMECVNCLLNSLEFISSPLGSSSGVQGGAALAGIPPQSNRSVGARGVCGGHSAEGARYGLDVASDWRMDESHVNYINIVYPTLRSADSASKLTINTFQKDGMMYFPVCWIRRHPYLRISGLYLLTRMIVFRNLSHFSNAHFDFESPNLYSWEHVRKSPDIVPWWSSIWLVVPPRPYMTFELIESLI